MILRKAYKVRLKTKADIQQVLTAYSGANRFVWNKALALNKNRLDREKKQRSLVWYNEMAFFLKLWKASDEYDFLRNTPSQTLQQTLKDLDKAMKEGFDKRQPLKRFPVFKRKHDTKSFRYPQGFKIEGKRLFLPKIGWVRFFKSQAIQGQAKSITLSKKGRYWYASIQVEIVLKKERTHPSKKAIGIDLGIKQMVTLSNGRHFKGRESFKKTQETLKKEQQKLARKTKFSSNWKKQKQKVGEVHIKISHSRQDRNHWISHRLTQAYHLIVCEALMIRNMSRSAKGDSEMPGRCVKQKSGLNRSIHDQGWYELTRQLEYKQQWKGGRLLKVNPTYTSQTCHTCGHKAKENRESQSVFFCKTCGHKCHADVNAAKNILAAGHAVLACGSNLKRGRKQEPLAA